MSGRYSDGDNRRVQARGTRARQPRSGPHLGPFRVTPARVTLLVALGGGLAFLAYSVIVRDQLQIPLMASGFAIVGLVFGAAAVMAAANVVRAGREGRDGTAVMTSVLGGLLAIAAFLSFAAAIIMGLIWGGTATS
ncbi:MAG: hypothetical protein AB1627_09695 [Chloroflexota bacterium]